VTIKRALLSVYDKTGIVAFARELHGLGVELLASGGTARALVEERIPVTPLEDVTGFAELLGHRVVSLHPAVHGGILARRDVPADLAELQAHGIEPIDLVCVNLYPFEKTVGRLDVPWEDAIEQIDVGGPALLRAAAKNHAHVVPLCRPADYGPLLEEFRSLAEVSLETRRELAGRAFQTTAAYDAAVAAWFGRDDVFPETFVPVFDRFAELSYGENPHQRAVYYAQRGLRTHLLARVEQVQGKPLSFNNLGDLSAARLLLLELEGPAAVIVKHGNPCGVGLGRTIEDAYTKALASDPVSAYGGVVALNRPVTGKLGRTLAKQFVEVLFAPGYDDAALTALQTKEATRVLADAERRSFVTTERDFRRVLGGLLVQDRDAGSDPLDGMDVVDVEHDAVRALDVVVGCVPRMDLNDAHLREGHEARDVVGNQIFPDLGFLADAHTAQRARSPRLGMPQVIAGSRQAGGAVEERQGTSSHVGHHPVGDLLVVTRQLDLRDLRLGKHQPVGM
jgi:phosphoribosylaminoimidazolecarboxamide formyltransferase/IMP cyclohydrolase